MVRNVYIIKFNLTEEIEEKIKGKLSAEGYKLWKELNRREPWDLVEVEDNKVFRELVEKGIIGEFLDKREEVIEEERDDRYMFMNTAGLEERGERPLGVDWDELFKEAYGEVVFY